MIKLLLVFLMFFFFLNTSFANTYEVINLLNLESEKTLYKNKILSNKKFIEKFGKEKTEKFVYLLSNIKDDELLKLFEKLNFISGDSYVLRYLNSVIGLEIYDRNILDYKVLLDGFYLIGYKDSNYKLYKLGNLVLEKAILKGPYDGYCNSNDNLNIENCKILEYIDTFKIENYNDDFYLYKDNSYITTKKYISKKYLISFDLGISSLSFYKYFSFDNNKGYIFSLINDFEGGPYLSYIDIETSKEIELFNFRYDIINEKYNYLNDYKIENIVIENDILYYDLKIINKSTKEEEIEKYEINIIDKINSSNV